MNSIAAFRASSVAVSSFSLNVALRASSLSLTSSHCVLVECSMSGILTAIAIPRAVQVLLAWPGICETRFVYAAGRVACRAKRVSEMPRLSASDCRAAVSQARSGSSFANLHNSWMSSADFSSGARNPQSSSWSCSFRAKARASVATFCKAVIDGDSSANHSAARKARI
jgi:hypothetical protein